jgi:tRNA threonylcarbamoyladenosine biosynthesis protein TsaB
MKILSIETSTMLGGVAILDEQAGLIAETKLNVKSTHSERLMTAVDNTLKQSEMTLDDIDIFAVAIGPGSFTGLRIGLSTAKGLSYATAKPLVTVPTLDAFAWNFPFSLYPVCLMLDARRSEVYAAVYKWEEDSFRTVLEPLSIRPGRLLGTLEGKILFAGDGALVYNEKIADIMKERAFFATADKMIPSPANVAMLGLERAIRGEYAIVAETVPLYIRKSEAEVKLLEKK